ncbi:hypothetical protein BDN72DRAFT_848822 [Pluteus cervinus]|nr:hypothetical protein BDN72DRAFT_848822 [Pluteus cervinus]
MYDTTSTLAQLSISHHGEYIGRGSLICALHSISAGKTPRFLYAKSTDSTSISRESKAPFSAYPMSSGMEDLIRNIPPMVVSNALIQSFFTQVNWRFGVPDQWFLSACTQMWKVLQYPEARGYQINANWLSLFFAVLASTPPETLHFYHQQINQFHSGDTNRTLESIMDDFFACSVAARRLAEEEHLKQPSLSLMNSAADGTVLGCLAVPLLCCYLAERGRVSEAWKLAGNAIRNAEAVGMHRDPAWRQWQIMSEDERLLRRRAWWGLVIWDMLYSFLLGRPKMIRKEIFDVALPSLDDPDVNQDPFNLYQAVLIQLSGIVGEALEKCFSVEYPNCSVFFEVDQKFHQWGRHLPPQFQCEYDDNSSQQHSNNYEAGYLSTLARHRYTLHTWYLLIRMKLHIASITGQGRTPQRRSHIEESRRLCTVFAMDLIRLQCETWENALQRKTDSGYDLPGSHWFFEGCFALFEAAVALVTTLTRYPWPEKAGEAEQLIDRAVVVLTQVVRAEEGKKGEIARMAVEVLTSLANEHWWRARSPSHGSPSSLEDDPGVLLHPGMYNNHGQIATQLSSSAPPPPHPAQSVALIGDLASPGHAHAQLYHHHQWYAPSNYEPSLIAHHQPHPNTLRGVASATEDGGYDVDSSNKGAI